MIALEAERLNALLALAQRALGLTLAEALFLRDLTERANAQITAQQEQTEKD